MPSSPPRTPRPTDALADPGYLFALANERHADHALAADWFGRQAAGFRLRICRMVQLAFLRLLTHPVAMDGHALSPAAAWTLYAGLLADPNIGFHHEPPDFPRFWLALATETEAPPPATYLAAFALRSELTLVTLDPVFATIADLHAEILRPSPRPLP